MSGTEGAREDVKRSPEVQTLLDLFGVDGEVGVEMARRLVEERMDDIKKEKRGLP